MTLVATIILGLGRAPEDCERPLDIEEFRAAIRDILERSGLSMRALSAAMGRNPGYIAALLDPTRPSRARPTPADLLRASDATGIAFVELLESLWGIPTSRMASELAGLGMGPSLDERVQGLSDAERASVADYVAFLAVRHTRRRASSTSTPRQT
jgi:transcriptional regulator with XRE-family HTH domain